MFRRRSRLARRGEVARLAGDDWDTFWLKMGVMPRLSGNTLLAEISVAGKPVTPLVVSLGPTSREIVVDALCRQLRMTEGHAKLFLECHRDKQSVLDAIREGFLSYPDDPSI